MSKKPRKTTEATKLIDQLTGTNQLIVGEESFEDIKKSNLEALEELRQNALSQLHQSAKLGLCIKDPKIIASNQAGRAGQLVTTLTNDVRTMKSEMDQIKARADQLAEVTEIVDFIPLALELGEEHQLWQSKFETGVLPVLEEIESLIKTVESPEGVTNVAE